MVDMAAAVGPWSSSSSPLRERWVRQVWKESSVLREVCELLEAESSNVVDAPLEESSKDEKGEEVGRPQVS